MSWPFEPGIYAGYPHFIGIVLALLLRSLIAPLYLLGAVTLNFLAAIGACSFFFQRIQGQDGFSYAIPLYTFIFLVALGADYGRALALDVSFLII